MANLSTLAENDLANVIDSLRDMAESATNSAEAMREDHSTQIVTDLEQDAAYLEKLAEDIENGKTELSRASLSDIFDALTASVNNCDELGEDDAALDYRATRAIVDHLFRV